MVSPGFSSTRGQLLVATPPLGDPNFDRTVVYMLEHNDEGALGVVINRPTEETSIDEIDAWCALATPPATIFEGGPVEPNALIGIGVTGTTREGDGWAPLLGGLGTVDLSSSPVEVSPVITRLRIFRGYSGWSPGQLEYELEEHAWMVLPAEQDDVFSAEPTRLWRTVIRRQGGRMTWIANAPEDLSAN